MSTSAPHHWETLPNELLLEVLSQLGIEDIKNVLSSVSPQSRTATALYTILFQNVVVGEEPADLFDCVNILGFDFKENQGRHKIELYVYHEPSIVELVQYATYIKSLVIYCQQNRTPHIESCTLCYYHQQSKGTNYKYGSNLAQLVNSAPNVVELFILCQCMTAKVHEKAQLNHLALYRCPGHVLYGTKQIMGIDSFFIPGYLWLTVTEENVKSLTQLDLILGLYMPVADGKTYNLPKLQRLSLASNEIKTVKNFTKEFLPNLEDINLERNRLVQIPDFFELPSLRNLNLNRNDVVDLSYSHTLHRVRILDLSFNELKDFEDLGNLYDLENLDLAGNHAERIPENFQNLTKLTRINANQNKLSNIYGLQKLSKLQIVGLGGNQLASLPNNLESWQNLEVLNLSTNLLSNIDSLSDLSNLQDLDASLNNISYLPSNMSKLQNLVQLNLADNRITNIDVFETVPNLQYVDISGNQVADVLQVVRRMPKLANIQL